MMELIYVSPCYFEDVKVLDADRIHMARADSLDCLRHAHPEAAFMVGPLVELQNWTRDGAER